MGIDTKPKCAIACDWILIILLGITYLLIKEIMEINSQCIPGATDQGLPSKYSCDENPLMEKPTPLLSFPYVKSKMLVYYPYLFGFFTWLFVVVVSLLIQLCCCATNRPSKWDAKIIIVKIETLWREMLTSLIITQLIVLWIKMFVGRPRPLVYEYYKIDSKDAVQSFPSGHASSSFCIHSLLICHVLYAMYFAYVNGEKPIYKSIEVDNTHCLFGAKIWQNLRHYNGLKSLFIVLLMVLPIYISCTRITDYYHNYSDVVCGAFIGSSVSTITFIIFNNELYHYSRARSEST